MFEEESVQKKPQITTIAIPVVIGLLTIAAILVLYIKMSPRGMSLSDANGTKESDAAASLTSSTTNSLGGQIYEKAQNPLDGKLETETPVANPIDGAYKNPFE